ncbi:MAG: hypothetical protein AVDCRST_MAG45-2033 [uncultured Solirubrobacterales bacterium]|uniref:Uncharacterized protein n=1 Tax=uncultured Solirubrobacterales bacterium TaxID=768556 RepID=A0A6J4T4Y2_9ACTN|nr:MAG: hypothetical protein AVDCRST_MAG45-2033 [uncultured Solirubrobacterales bacterium]
MPPVPPRRGLGRGARRLAPFALEAWRRWQALSPEEKERYRAMARRYADRGRGIGRGAVDRARDRRRPR